MTPERRIRRIQRWQSSVARFWVDEEEPSATYHVYCKLTERFPALVFAELRWLTEYAIRPTCSTCAVYDPRRYCRKWNTSTVPSGFCHMHEVIF